MSESNLLQAYNSKVVPLLQEKFKYKNKHQIPAINKVTLNIGLGEAVQNPKAVEAASKQLALISGQKPVVTKAKRSIAGFKLREGMPIGCMVTLRNVQMWTFLDNCFTLQCLVFVTLGVFPQKPLMEQEIIPWELKNN